MNTKPDRLKQKVKELEEEIANLKRAEKKLKNAVEDFKKIIEFAPDPIYISDLRGNLVDGNQAAEKLAGYKKEELIGKNFVKTLLSPQQAPEMLKLVAQIVFSKRIGPLELVLNRKDGNKIIIEVTGAPIKVKGKTLIVGIARDITKHKQLREDLKKRNEELERFHKLAVGRELKMVELKKRMKSLKGEIENFKKDR